MEKEHNTKRIDSSPYQSFPFSKHLNVHKIALSSKENGVIRCPHLKASIEIRHVFFVFLRSTVLFITTLNEVWNPSTPDPHFGFF
jgi:hypothetical protein